ncbi:lysophosphatidylserine lipase ABHD12-like [Xiphias gladius]|uniref:lysophosphatidylserine lipase ABHD12-like n=1 Tax=Xiphias gladius TaxID=8245 RepID=UPI001A991610|nr:lysophosphatidylserine lipase ABHD12-like [Xiphias gladius]XP_039993169.1 lysophosphatidylserine lipase ABHD12-like [Xiphias gladius]XP_039993170.1 lysophosphatidylserine lipase ABHD12-like [Xiphias gladius]
MAGTKRAVSFLITVYVSVPVFLYLFPWILGHAIYAHLLRFPLFVDLGKPEDVLNHTCNFYLNTEEGISVGVWHTLPVNQWEEAVGKNPEWYWETLGDGHPVIIYLHGNLGTRAINHRVELVKILSTAGYHVLSLDYRGFGDSSGEPSEAGLTSDALYLYQWVKKKSRGSLVCFWGHSLGSGVATNVALKLQEQGSAIDALILEAPYTRMREAVANHPLAKMYMFLPGFESLLWNILERNKIVFANDKNLKTLTSPLLILHSEDDNVVPYHMGLKLYQISLQAQKKYNTDVQVEMISYSANLGFSHSNIYLDPNLSKVVRGFLQKLRQ